MHIEKGKCHCQFEWCVCIWFVNFEFCQKWLLVNKLFINLIYPVMWRAKPVIASHSHKSWSYHFTIYLLINCLINQRNCAILIWFFEHGHDIYINISIRPHLFEKIEWWQWYHVDNLLPCPLHQNPFCVEKLYIYIIHGRLREITWETHSFVD